MQLQIQDILISWWQLGKGRKSVVRIIYVSRWVASMSTFFLSTAESEKEGRKEERNKKKEGPRSKWTWNISWEERERSKSDRIAPFQLRFFPLMKLLYPWSSIHFSFLAHFNKTQIFLVELLFLTATFSKTVLNKTSFLSFTRDTISISITSIGMIDRFFFLYEMIINWKWQSKEGERETRKRNGFHSSHVPIGGTRNKTKEQDRVMKLLTWNASTFHIQVASK